MVDRDTLDNEFCENYDYLYDYAGYMGIDTEHRDDFMDEVYEESVKSLRKGRGPADGMVLPWIKGVARNRARKYFRKKYRHNELFDMAELELSELDRAGKLPDRKTVESEILDAEMKATMKILLDTLPETTRKIYIMYAWGGNTFPEIADILGINLNTAKSLYYRNREILRERYIKMTGEEGLYD